MRRRFPTTCSTPRASTERGSSASSAPSSLPTIQPVLATLALWTFLATWNDFMWPLIVLSDDRKYTLPVALAGLVGEHAQDVELMMAGAVITVLPVLILFLMLQRYYVEGVTEGSVK